MNTPPTTAGTESRRQEFAIWAAAAALPVLSHGAALFINVEPSEWLTMSAPVRWSLAADAMLYTAGCAIVAAPVAGVAVTTTSRFAGRDDDHGVDVIHAVWTLVIASVAFTVMSALISMGWHFGQADSGGLVVQSHATVLSVALALVAWGAFCGTWFRDPLDAAACGLVVALTAAGGLLVAGALVADLPPSVLAWGLTANPLVVIASAAHIDVARMDLLYQISPLAHIQFDYPSWGRTCGLYLAIALACFVGATFKSRVWLPASAT